MSTAYTPPMQGASWRIPALFATAGLVLGGIGSTLALWSTSDDVDNAVVTAGSLDIELVGDSQWEDTTQCVAQEIATATSLLNEYLEDGDITQAEYNSEIAKMSDRTFDPANHYVRPGDTIRFTQDFTGSLEGDNMLGAINVSWAQPLDLPEGVTGTFTLYNGEEVVGEGVVGEDTEITRQTEGALPTYTLAVDIDIDSSLECHASAPGQDIGGFDLNTITVSLDQVRDGEGFTS